jgi:CHAT domain-containing protein/tetratricopeptide (TPR) repeat protein
MTHELGEAVARLKALLVDYGGTTDPALLDQAMSLSGELTRSPSLTDLGPDDIAVVWSLGGAARIHHSRLSDHPDDLDDAIAWCRRALDAASDDDSNRPLYASNLATILTERYDRDKHRADLDEALALFEWAVPAIRAGRRSASVAVHGQGQALLEFYKADHDRAVLNRAIEVLREAVVYDRQPRSVAGGYLTSLGQALRAWAEAADNPSALDEAVRILRRAVDWTAGSADHVAALVSLGNALLDRSEIGRGTRDLAEAVSYLDRGFSLVTPGTSRWGARATDLGKGLVAEFRATGQRASLLRARELFKAAAEIFADSPADRETCLSSLVACLQELHNQTGELSFLDEAIEVYRDALSWPVESASAARLHNFGVTLLTRFKRYESPDDLNQAIAQFRAAVRVAPPNSETRAAATNSLGNALFSRYDLLRQAADLDAAIIAHEQAVRTARENSIDRAMYRANLGVGLMTRGQEAGSAADVEAAICEQETAAAAIPQASQEYVWALAALADSLAARATLTGSGADAAQAHKAYRSATLAGLERLPEQAIGRALSWGTWASARQSLPQAAEAFEYGLQALERLFATQLTRLHKETWLRDAQGISVRAAYALTMAGDATAASQAFERGRALLLSESLQRDRADLERLAEVGRADLKDRYEAAVSRWNRLSRLGDDASVLEPGMPATATRTTATLAGGLREAREELDAAIAEIRTVPGNQRFLLPPTVADIRAGVGGHPLVYLGATEWGGLALIVHPGDAPVAASWLPGLTEQALADRVRAYRDVYRAYLTGPRTEKDRTRWESAIDTVTAWAWNAVMAPVLEALGDARRATLVPAGLLGVLPLHAAWTADPACPTGRRYALDQTVLTYAPNAQALGAARRRHDEILGDHLVAVDEPDLGAAAPRLRLPFSALEVAAATATFDDHEILAGADADAESVLAALSRAQCFHLSCHGRADPASPLEAALAMAGGQPLTLRNVLGQRLTARVGVLSACETAIPGDELPDEVISLPTGLIQAGLGTAVASLWSVPGTATALLMFRFYERWRVVGADPAQALNDAQRWLRDTDTGEKITYFEDIALDDDHPMAGAAQEPYELLYRTTDPARRDGEHPYQWAAFTCVGA